MPPQASSNGAPIELVVFDLGGVMIRLNPPPPLGTHDRRDELMALVPEHETGRMDDALFIQRVADISRHTTDEIEQMVHGWIVGPYPGIVELVDELAGSPVRTACLSNTNNLHWPRMHDPGHPTSLPLPALDHRFASHLVGMRKPDEAIYRHVERETGVADERIVFFDDNAENVAAAQACGWQALQIDPAADPPGQVRGWLAGRGVL